MQEGGTEALVGYFRREMPVVGDIEGEEWPEERRGEIDAAKVVAAKEHHAYFRLRSEAIARSVCAALIWEAGISVTEVRIEILMKVTGTQ